FRILERETDCENSADARRTFDFDRTAVVFDDFLGDVETETGAAFRLFGREIRIENSIQLCRMNAGPGVFNTKIDIEILLSAGNRHCALLFDGSLDRVDDYVLNRAVDLQRIAQEGAGIFADVRLEFDSVLGCHRRYAF